MDEINAAIGGTGSDLGVYRLQHDVLDHQPDLLFVEFAVNDFGAAPERIHRAMEGIVRQTWRAQPATDICYVYTISTPMLKDLREGKFPRSATAMEEVADHYGIPSTHMGLEVVRLEQAGKLLFAAPKPKTDEERAAVADKVLFSPDGVHPYEDSGHRLYLEAVARSMAKILPVGAAGPHLCPAPLDPQNWEAAKMVPLSRTTRSAGWQKLDPATDGMAKRFANRFPELWLATQPGESIAFRFRGTACSIYDILGPNCGQVTISLDDRPPTTVARFDSYCTYHRIAKMTVGDGLPDAVHTVSLAVHPDQPDKARILSQRNQKIDDPKRFDGTAWYAGAVLLIGEIVE